MRLCIRYITVTDRVRRLWPRGFEKKIAPLAESSRPMVPRPRRERDSLRARNAAHAARSAGAPAMEAALVQIGAAFDEAAAINGFKMRVEHLIRLGPHHPAVRARFGARAAMLGYRDLGAALAAVERWRRQERKAFQIARAFGGGTRLSLEVLTELRLILRLMRAKHLDAQYQDIISALLDTQIAAAAE